MLRSFVLGVLLLPLWCSAEEGAERAADLVARVDDPQSVTKLSALGAKALPALLSGLEATEHKDVILHLLGEIGDVSSLPTILNYVADPVIEYRMAAVYALRKFQSPDARSAAVKLLQDPEPRVEMAALHALLAQKAAAEAPAIAGLLEAKDWSVRKEAARILGELRAKDVIPALAGRLRFDLVEEIPPPGKTKPEKPKRVPRYTETIPAVRMECIRSLGLIGSPGAVEAFLPLFAYGADVERQAAVDAIGRIGKDVADTVFRRIGQVAEKPTADSPDVLQAIYLTVGLARLGDARAVPSALRLVSMADAFAGIELIRFLGENKVPEAGPVLARMVKDCRVQQVQAALFAALPRIGAPASDALLEFLPDRTVCVDIMNLLGKPGLNHPKAVPKFLEYLEDEDQDIRQAAVVALVAHQAKDAVSALKSVLVLDPDERVREAAADAIKALTGEDMRK